MVEREKSPNESNVVVMITGLALGEETKGATVEWLTKELGAHTVIRSGGCQAGHHVTKADGREFQFSHFGCGTFDGAETHLQDMTIFPAYLFDEASKLEEMGVDDPLSKITIDEDCLAITPFHGAFSRVREVSRGPNKKGTIGMGVGNAIKDAQEHPEFSIKAGEFLGDEATLSHKVEAIRQRKLEQTREVLATVAGLKTLAEVQKELDLLEDENLASLTVQSFLYLADLVRIVDDEYLNEILAQEGAVVCEPSHGALHHPRYGFVPHITQIDPTSQDVLKTLQEREHKKKIVRLGVSRCYMTRHGAGPLVSFSREMTDQIQETHNVGGSEWLGEFRNGHYDLVAMRYAIEISGGKNSYDGLMISYLDVLAKYEEWQIVEAYTYEGEEADDLDQYFELDNEKIVGIKVHPDTGDQDHLEHQMRLTELLKKCRPILTTLKPDKDKSLEQVFLDYVEEKLGIPVVAVSHGPKVEDREIRFGWEHLFTQGIGNL